MGEFEIFSHGVNTHCMMNSCQMNSRERRFFKEGTLRNVPLNNPSYPDLSVFALISS